MSQNGIIEFYSEHQHPSVHRLVMGAAELTGAAEAVSVWRSMGPDRGWLDFIEDVDESDDELLGRNVPLSQLSGLFMSDRVLKVRFGETPLGLRIDQAIRAEIPESIRGDHAPCDPFLVIGFHDLFFEDESHPEGRLVGRPFFSFQLFGYGTPSDWKQFRALIFGVSELKELKAKLEAFTGPMAQCVYWSI
jgi:hypothetical protein